MLVTLRKLLYKPTFAPIILVNRETKVDFDFKGLSCGCQKLFFLKENILSLILVSFHILYKIKFPSNELRNLPISKCPYKTHKLM